MCKLHRHYICRVVTKITSTIKLNEVLVSARTAPPLYCAELLMKLMIPVKCSELADAQIAPELYLKLALFLRKVVFPVNVTALLRAVIPHPNLHHLHPHWLLMNLLSSARVMLVLCTASAVPRLHQDFNACSKTLFWYIQSTPTNEGLLFL